jgi:hypothetical protein
MPDNTPGFPGDVEPDGMSELPVHHVPVFALTLSNIALDSLISENGLCPTNDIRLTIAQELKKFAPLWIVDTVHMVATRIKHSN